MSDFIGLYILLGIPILFLGYLSFTTRIRFPVFKNRNPPPPKLTIDEAYCNRIGEMILKVECRSFYESRKNNPEFQEWIRVEKLRYLGSLGQLCTHEIGGVGLKNEKGVCAICKISIP